MNFYPFHIGDYISHTSHLSDAEDLAYRRMIDLYFMNELPFNDSSTVARRIRSSVEIVDAILSEFFEFGDDDCWHNKRADEEIAKYHSRLNQASRAGKASAEARSNARSTGVQPTKNQEPEPITNIKNKSITPPIGVDLLVWNDFVAHRKSKKAPISATALKGIEVEARKANISLQAALEICCARGWTGFKAEWLADKTTAIQSRQEKNMEGLHQLTGGMLRPKKDYSVFPSIVMEESNVQLLGS